MVRRYGEPIEVRAGEGDTDRPSDTDRATSVPAPVPSAFLWRGRLYVVRDVIGHWRERRAWWREALDPHEPDEADEEAAAHGLDRPASLDCLEQEVWRVEASPGRLSGTGVYDLGMNDLGMDGINGPARSWRLLRVAD